MSAASDSFAAGATPSQCSSLVVSSAMETFLSSILDASGYDAEDPGANRTDGKHASDDRRRRVSARPERGDQGVRARLREREEKPARCLRVREQEKIGLGHARRDLQDGPRRREVAAARPVLEIA